MAQMHLGGKTMSNYNEYWNNIEICNMLEALWKVEPYQLERQKYTDNILSMSPASILDIGCGCGVLYKNLKHSDPNISNRYKGVDISQPFLDKFTAAYPDADVSLENGETLSFDDNSFEAVVFYDVLRHQPEYETLLTEALRVSSKYVFMIETFVNNENDEDLEITYKWYTLDIYDNWYSRDKMKNFIHGLYPSGTIQGNTDRILIVDIS